MEKRTGFVGVLLKNRKKTAPQVNKILSEFGEIITGRMGLPYEKKKRCVITLIVDATTDEVGRLTGQLGQLDGVSVKSGLCKE
ncbi:MAG: TM1266 family iron-only hydrogenase system putative regulator [bacterium]